MKKYFLFIFLAIWSFTSHSQTSSCINDFDFLVKQIQNNYPGYHDKVNNQTLPKLLELEKKLRKKLTENPDSCYFYMQEYTNFFKDYHLRIRRYHKPEKQQKRSEIMECSSYGKNIKVDIDSLMLATAKSKGIEGVWKSFWGELAIVKEYNGSYIAVAINYNDWKSGQVMNKYNPLSDSTFNVINYSLIKDAKASNSEASLHLNGKILEMNYDTRYVRKSNSSALDIATLYSYIPEYPNGINVYPVALYLSDSTYYIRIPNFYSNTANELVAKHFNEITNRPNLIIDIRNNGGGQDDYYQNLAKLIYTKPYISKGVEWYASQGNIDLFEDAIKNGEIIGGEDGLKWTNALVDAMKHNIGGYVTHPFYQSKSDTIKRDTIYPTPRNIGIIINDGNASSAEQFLLTAKQSNKVILFGNCNTAGILDYSNITPHVLPSENYQLLCPMTRSKRLPNNPIDNIGIAPDVIIPLPVTEQLYDRLDSWVYFVKQYLEALSEKK